MFYNQGPISKCECEAALIHLSRNWLEVLIVAWHWIPLDFDVNRLLLAGSFLQAFISAAAVSAIIYTDAIIHKQSRPQYF